ncbi:MAG: GntR family transcriptional regulator [Bacteroidota bacterium]|jgi:DNA-binding GntR family transcriptional regulator
MLSSASAAATGPSGVAAEERVYTAIRQAIMDHRLTPGTKLKEVALAELFAVSRATVRAALARLAHAQLVELRPNRGAIIPTPSAAESREVFEARRAIECAIAAKVAATASRKDVAALREWVATEAAAYARGDDRDGLRRSIEFHRRLAALAGNAVLTRFLDELVYRTPLIALTHRGHAPSTCGVDDHLALVDAIGAHEPERAVTVMREHIEALERELNLHRPEPPKTLAEIFARPAQP